MTAVHHTPMQRCICGTEFFIVHSCPLKMAPEPVMRTIIDITKSDLLNHIEDLERLVREQQITITNLMLELADVRSELERLAPTRWQE